MNTPLRLIPFGLTACLKSLLVLVLCSFAITQAEAQVAPNKTYQDWQSVENGADLEDFSWRVVACGQENCILFSVFNEQPVDRVIDFHAVIADPLSGNSFEFDFNEMVPAVTSIKADCSGAFFPNLKVALPNGYDPKTITVTISY
ncbi:MAG: hypothetical protein JNN28_19385 [Saprospiraceae bacterium]|nr:hypothetical protein [Saprospiraceae bacterium]